MKIRESIALWNWRNKGKLKKLTLSGFVRNNFPKIKDVKSKTQTLNDGCYNEEEITRISIALGVDPNFIAGRKSVHDSDYVKMKREL